jgi:hypothetical protein
MAIATHYLFARMRMQLVGGMTFLHIPYGRRKIVISICCSQKW